MCRIIIDGKAYTVSKGTLLSDVLMAKEGRAEHPCGGKGICKKCTVLVDGKKELSCQYVIEKDITVSLPEREDIDAFTDFNISCGDSCDSFFALDIGTTTLALAVVSSSGNVSRVITRNNPQRVYGADVISRIEYCTKNGVGFLRKILVDEINDMISSLEVTADKMYVSGNTTMLHTLFGEDCSSMGVYPYTPSFLESRSVRGESLGIINVERAESLPCIHSFVGADIVAGINCLPMPREGKYNLLVDLGTNAEIALVGENEVICTSAAAGPCFEGVGISCGMAASSGAIYEYSEKGFKTVNGKKPVGICGTGLIDIVAFLLRNGKIDETGYMEGPYRIADGISVTEGDIRQFQLAKSAVYSGIITLLKSNSVSFEKIERLYISGGFSHKINMENASLTGLFPIELKEKYESINNSSLRGTIEYALGKNDLKWIKKARYEDLSNDPLFSEIFIESMGFNNESSVL